MFTDFSISGLVSLDEMDAWMSFLSSSLTSGSSANRLSLDLPDTVILLVNP